MQYTLFDMGKVIRSCDGGTPPRLETSLGPRSGDAKRETLALDVILRSYVQLLGGKENG